MDEFSYAEAHISRAADTYARTVELRAQLKAAEAELSRYREEFGLSGEEFDQALCNLFYARADRPRADRATSERNAKLAASLLR